MLFRKYVLQFVSGGKYPKICATADESLVERKGQKEEKKHWNFGKSFLISHKNDKMSKDMSYVLWLYYGIQIFQTF